MMDILSGGEPLISDVRQSGAGTVAGVAIARLPLIVIDCPDPGVLARFYGAMLD